MRLTLEQALSLAEKHGKVLSASQSADHWYFEVGGDYGPLPGGSPVAISKTNGEITFPLASIPSEVLGVEPSPEETEYLNATAVKLPSAKR